MKKTTALYNILDFGRAEEHDLLAHGKIHEAYQIEHARNALLQALVTTGIKGAREALKLSVTRTYDANGNETYNHLYVYDDATREMLTRFEL